MPFTVPNAVSATYPEQAQLDKGDFDALAAGSNLTGTVSGCGVTVTSGLTVRLAAGTVRIAGTTVTVAQQDFALTADATQKTFYLITVNTSGTGAAEAGSAAASPTFPDVPAAYALPPTKAIQAAVLVPGGAVSLATGNIVDKRVAVQAGDITVQDEGTPLATKATALNFTGTGVAASGTGAVKTIFVPGSGSVDFPWVDVKADFGATGDGTADDTAEIQAAIDFINTRGQGGVVLFPLGSYRVTSSLTWYRGVCLRGEHGTVSGANTSWPELLWYNGPTTSDVLSMVQVDPFASSNTHSTWIERLRIRKHPSGTNRFRRGVNFTNHGDMFTRFQHIQIIDALEYGLYFGRGGINTVISDFRIDGCDLGAIYWKLGTIDCLKLSNFTVDNFRTSAATVSGGALVVDGVGVGNNVMLWLEVDNGRIELNSSLAANSGAFRFDIDPAVSQRFQVQGAFTGVTVEPGPGATDTTGLRVNPASDHVRFVRRNCRFTVAGIPSYRNSIVGSNSRVVSDVIAPIHLKIQSSSENTADETHGATNLNGPVYQRGQEAVLRYKVLPSSLSAGSLVYKGDEFYDASALAGGSTSRAVVVAVSDGTVGALSGVTGTGTSGANRLTLSSVTSIMVGQRIAIAGANSNVQVIALETNDAILSANLSATVSGAAVTWVAPTYRQQAQTLAAWP